MPKEGKELQVTNMDPQYRYDDNKVVQNYTSLPQSEKSHIEWKDFSAKEEKDLLAFMGDFTFPNLNQLKTSLQKSGYKKSEIEEIIAGLKTLPEYSD